MSIRKVLIRLWPVPRMFLDCSPVAQKMHMKVPRLVWLVVLLWSTVLTITRSPLVWAQNRTQVEFLVKPYLQLGNHDKLTATEAAELVWISESEKDNWQLQIRSKSDGVWRTSGKPKSTAISSLGRMFIFHTNVAGLTPGATFYYRLLKNDREVFEGQATARKASTQPYRIVLFGDMGANTQAQRKVAFQIFQKKPDMVVYLGDIVYDYGLIREYLENFFPIYNCEKASPDCGAPLMRATISTAVLGNHDVGLSANNAGIDLDKISDGLAYFEIWSEPLNGPTQDCLGANTVKLLGATAKISQYLRQTNGRFPRMANYSFDYGNSHWLIIDANPYMDWTSPCLRNWVASDLAQASRATWKFVCFDQPGCSIDTSHFKEQRMRLLCDLFEQGGVDMVFSGHAHDYQRSFPLYFKAKREKGRTLINLDGTVDGEFTLDKIFDGNKNPFPRGIIYVVSGAGGAPLYPSVQSQNPFFQKTFTDRFIGTIHSFTLCEVEASTVNLSQISEDGNVLDHFSIKKSVVVPAKPTALPEKSGLILKEREKAR